jgi:hypothetical protein
LDFGSTTKKGDYGDRSFWFKLGVRLARLTAPVQ